MQTKNWITAERVLYDPDEMTSIAMEAMDELNMQTVLDIDGEQMFNDLETLTDIKRIATEQVSESHLDYVGMLRAVNDIKSRWYLSPSIGLETATSPRETFLKEIDVAIEGIASNITNWIGAKFASMWKTLKNLFKVSEQVRSWLDENEATYDSLVAGNAFELKWKMYYGHLVINNKLDVPRHLDMASHGRELVKLAESFYAKAVPSRDYELDTFNFDEETKRLERIGMNLDTSAAIRTTMRFGKLGDDVDIIALPGNVYITTGNDGAIRKTLYTVIAFDKASDTLPLTSNDTKRMTTSLRKLVDTASAISFKANKQQPNVKKAEAAVDKYWDDGKGDIKQLRQDVQNAINFEMGISSAIVRTLLGLHMAASQSLKQAKKLK